MRTKQIQNGHNRIKEVDVAKRLAVGMVELASLGTFVAMVLTWAAVLSGPGV